ncbi:MAG: glycosyltransferase family 4 protein [Lachnospiraceae bacterium]|nr:glycosyltransferase family 4 protein [Lachnospiraceae bacterium]
MNQPKVLIVANVAKEHIRKFHIPTINLLKDNGWRVDVACKLDVGIPEADNAYAMCWERTPFTIKTFKGMRALRNIIAENQYDIVYCHTPVGGLVTRFAARSLRKKGVKVVYCAHGLHFFNGAPLINWLLYYPMERWMAKFTDMFIAINEEDYNRVTADFNHKMSVKLINGIGVNFDRLNVKNPSEIRQEYRKQLNISQNDIVLIYVAEIIKNKNQQMIIRALKEIHNRGYKAHLLLAGPDHHNGEFIQLANNLGLSKNVHFLGWRSDIGNLMASSDIYVASSIREGLGINLVEAQFCHLPVVASSNRGHRSIIRDGQNGFLVPINNHIIMANRIIELITDRTTYKKLSNVDVASYACDKVAQTIYSYLNEIIVSSLA